jgi:hypothetical protein
VVSWNCKHVQHVKIYLPCNFEVNQLVTGRWFSPSIKLYGSWIYNYLCNQCLSSLKLWIRILLIARFTQYSIMW